MAEDEGLVVVVLAVVLAGDKELAKDVALVEDKVLAVVVPVEALAGSRLFRRRLCTRRRFWPRQRPE